ncbi:hypothetical protein OH782_42305 (plasmid) [Streptomyces sp. NBC_01544]|nr:hypothetical protein [Streptomyces sp. AK08-01B]MDX3771215.1 hypothetical protein [Streptomyces sp. AK08-01B]
MADFHMQGLTDAMVAFAEEASVYLNTGKLPRPRHWRFPRTSDDD